MKNFGNYKKIVEILRKKDKDMAQVQKQTVKKPKTSSVEDLESFVEDFCDVLGQHLQDSTGMFSYITTKLSLLEEEQKILEKIEKQENPEEILFTLDSKLFRDYEFIANVIAICAPKIGSIAEEWAKKTYDEMKAENKDFAKTSRQAWIKEHTETQSANFNNRLVQKFVKAQKDLNEENNLLEEQLEEELNTRKEQLIIHDVIPPEKN